ncbi:hypothetical protein SDC9_138294 [bioreactor metagenome]|uniref:Uncharacterized protein n=1 Tax=bioreactor metagenome TaxID=1076179 RepID=A0A645DPC7_9ZZZZ
MLRLFDIAFNVAAEQEITQDVIVDGVGFDKIAVGNADRKTTLCRQTIGSGDGKVQLYRFSLSIDRFIALHIDSGKTEITDKIQSFAIDVSQ